MAKRKGNGFIILKMVLLKVKALSKKISVMVKPKRFLNQEKRPRYKIIVRVILVEFGRNFMNQAKKNSLKNIKIPYCIY